MILAGILSLTSPEAVDMESSGAHPAGPSHEFRDAHVSTFLTEIRQTMLPERGGRHGPLPPMLVAMTVVTGLVAPSATWSSATSSSPT